MKKTIIAVIVIAVMVLGGFSAYAVQGLDESDSTRILAEDGYATLTTDKVGGSAVTTKDALKSALDGKEPGIHVTDTYSVFSLDDAFLKSLLENVSGSTVTFSFGYNGDKSAVTFQIKDESGKAGFGKSGRCVGELPYHAGSSSPSAVAMNDGNEPVGFSAYFPDANLIHWQLAKGGTYTVTVKEKSFTDSKDHWGSEYIHFLASRGVANGVGDNSFRPDTSLTRAQYVTFLAGLAMEDAAQYSNDEFSDVKKGEWYYPYIAWAASNGVVSGMGDGTFHPNNKITREQLAQMTISFFRYMGMETKGIRTQADFSDAASISGWAQSAVGLCQGVGVINGFPNGTFAPQNNATRAEAATMCSRIVSYGLVMPQ